MNVCDFYPTLWRRFTDQNSECYSRKLEGKLQCASPNLTENNFQTWMDPPIRSCDNVQLSYLREAAH